MSGAVKPTVFIVTDIETTLKKRIMFDCAWVGVDRYGKEYCRGSYVIREAFSLDVPFFKHKLGYYFSDTYAHLIQPVSIVEFHRLYNADITALQEAGHRVILCAYNAAFDFKYMPETYRFLTGNEDARFLTSKVELLDIWAYWGESVPKHYKAQPTKSGNWLSTSAESAIRFERNQYDFEEGHIAWQDVQIEAEILQAALARRKKMPVVTRPSDFRGAVWRDINIRLGVTGKAPLAPLDPS